jgi:hypothetical protein
MVQSHRISCQKLNWNRDILSLAAFAVPKRPSRVQQAQKLPWIIDDVPDQCNQWTNLDMAETLMVESLA